MILYLDIIDLMGDEKTIEQIWEGTKDIFLPYEGSASQLHMLDIPREYLGDIATIYLNHVKCESVSVTSLDYGKSWENFTLEVQELFLKKEDVFKNWIFDGWLDSGRSLRLFVDEGGEPSFNLEHSLFNYTQYPAALR